MRKLRKKNIYKNIVLLKVLNADRRAPASFGETNVTGSGVLIRGRKQAEELRHVQSTDVTLLLLLLLLFHLPLLIGVLSFPPRRTRQLQQRAAAGNGPVHISERRGARRASQSRPGGVVV